MGIDRNLERIREELIYERMKLNKDCVLFKTPKIVDVYSIDAQRLDYFDWGILSDYDNELICNSDKIINKLDIQTKSCVKSFASQVRHCDSRLLPYMWMCSILNEINTDESKIILDIIKEELVSNNILFFANDKHILPISIVLENKILEAINDFKISEFIKYVIENVQKIIDETTIVHYYINL